MFGEWTGTSYLTLALIVACVIDDIKSRKVHNWLVLAILGISTVSTLVLDGFASYGQILTSLVAGAAFSLPLYLLNALGGGDIKMIIAISPLFGWVDLLGTVFYSLIWGALLGLAMVLLQKQGLRFAHNLFSLAKNKRLGKEDLHKIPFTVAILFGFLSQLLTPVGRFL